MKKNLHFFNLILCLMISTISVAQKSIKLTGTIKDSNTLENIYAAKVAIVPLEGDNEIYSTYTDFTGTFTLKARISKNRLKVSFFNYKTTYITIDEVASGEGDHINLGSVMITPDIQKQVENTSSIVDVVENRKTPIASSTLFQNDLRLVAANKDFIESTSDMSGVYVSRMGGGFGDSQMRLRGFEQNNITPMVDGISLYDLENGNVDWSSLMTLNNAISSVQLQKGLGASKLVNSSVAGSVNFLFKDAFASKGGDLFTSVGNNGFRKFGASYSTGKMKSGFGLNFMLNTMASDGYNQNTAFNATGYFLALGYENTKHNFQFKLFGTPQWHNQNNTMPMLFNYYDNKIENFDPTYSLDWGYYNGKKYSAQSNNSHKPMAIFQWDFKFNDQDQLSLKTYGTKGKSADVRLMGHSPFNFDLVNSPYVTGGPNYFTNSMQIDFDYINAFNSGAVSYDRVNQDPNYYKFAINGLKFNSILDNYFYNENKKFYEPTTFGGTSQVANNKEILAFGGIANIDKKISKVFKLNAGVDYRKTAYQNYRTVENLFGSDAYAISSNYFRLLNDVAVYSNYITKNDVFKTEDLLWNPFNSTSQSSKVNYDYTSNVNYLGGYAQLEANFKKVNLLAQGGYNRQFLSRETTNLITNSSNDSKTVKIDGYNAKLGANFNITDKHNVWANGGVVSRAPIYTNVFSSYSDIPNTVYKNENFQSAELGYGFTLKNLILKLNGYWAVHKDATIPYNSGISGFFGATTGINRENVGFEYDCTFKPFQQMEIFSSFSYGIWKYKTDANFVDFNTQNVSILKVKDHNVGGIPQTMANLGFKVFVANGLQLGVKGKFFDRFYSNAPIERFDPVYYTSNYFESVNRLPDYTTFDFLVDYSINIHDRNKLKLTFNMDNIFNREYITESDTSYGFNQKIGNLNDTYGSYYGSYRGVSKNNRAFFGLGTTWNFSASYSF